MGTRADFYVGRGESAEWLGSIAWDGYPDGILRDVLEAQTEEEYRIALSLFVAERRDFTRSEQGWPWPWKTSHTTDYAYAFDNGKVWASCFGYQWFNPLEPEPEHSSEEGKVAVFPDMTAIQNVDMGARSGLIVLRVGRMEGAR